MSEQRYDSSRWTGNLTPQPVDPEVARARLRWGLPLAVILLFYLLYVVGWHLLWKASGSPAVYDVPNGFDLLVPLLSAAAGYVLGRRWQKWPQMCAALTGCVAVGIWGLGSFLLDLHSPSARGEQRAFVESALAPRYPPRRHMRLEHELRFSVSRRRPREAIVPETLYREVVAGDTCLQIRWSGGRRYRFFEVVRHVATGDGNGSWLNAPKDRARCLRGN